MTVLFADRRARSPNGALLLHQYAIEALLVAGTHIRASAAGDKVICGVRFTTERTFSWCGFASIYLFGFDRFCCSPPYLLSCQQRVHGSLLTGIAGRLAATRAAARSRVFVLRSARFRFSIRQGGTRFSQAEAEAIANMDYAYYFAFFLASFSVFFIIVFAFSLIDDLCSPKVCSFSNFTLVLVAVVALF